MTPEEEHTIKSWIAQAARNAEAQAQLYGSLIQARNYDMVRELAGITEGHTSHPDNVDKLATFIEELVATIRDHTEDSEKLKLAILMPTLAKHI